MDELYDGTISARRFELLNDDGSKAEKLLVTFPGKTAKEGSTRTVYGTAVIEDSERMIGFSYKFIEVEGKPGMVTVDYLVNTQIEIGLLNSEHY